MYGCVLESPHQGNYNTHPKHVIFWRTYNNLGENNVFSVKKNEYVDIDMCLSIYYLNVLHHLIFTEFYSNVSF